MANRDVEARLRISAVDRTAGVLGRVAERLGLVSSRANQVTGRFNAVTKAANNSGYMLGRGLVAAAAVVGGAKVIKDAAELERQMNRIGITADATVDKTKAATEALREMTNVVALPFQEGVEALDVLVASGMSLDEAMSRMPAILATAQATGAATVDIANTAIKSTSALKIQSDEMQRAFDILVTQGKLGQFEAADMARYLPDVLNLWASIGYEGTDGLNMLAASLQTLREDAADAGTAANQLQNILAKMNSREVIKRFEEYGIDLPEEMKRAEAADIDPLRAFVGLTEKAIDGNMDLLPQLFGDLQMYQGMLTLLTSKDRLAHFMKGGQDADGAVDRDLQRVLDDSQASIDRMANSWDEFLNKLGMELIGPTKEALNFGTDLLDIKNAQMKYIERLDIPEEEKRKLRGQTAIDLLFEGGPTVKQAQMAIAGGYKGDFHGRDILEWAIDPTDPYYQRNMAGIPAGLLPSPDQAEREPLPDSWEKYKSRNDLEFLDDPSIIPPVGGGYMPPYNGYQPPLAAGGGENGRAQSIIDRFLALFETEEAQAGTKAIGKAFTDGAEDIRAASNEAKSKMNDVGRNVEAGGDDIADSLSAASAAIKNATQTLEGAAGRLQRRRANINPGRSMPPEANAPAGAYE